jgi:hypothetical protein
MLGQGKGARRFNDLVTLTYAAASAGTMGHAVLADPVDVVTVYASVQRMSATKSMLTFQQADVVGVEVEFRDPGAVTYNGLKWNGHAVYFSAPERLDNRGRIIRIQGWYQEDNPFIPAPAPEPEPETQEES